MVNYNILAIINPGDESNKSLEGFFDKLPEGSRIMLKSKGYVGNTKQFLEDRLRVPKDYTLISSPTKKGLDTSYFASHIGAAVVSIPNLSFKILLTGHGSGKDPTEIFGVTGEIESIIDQYREFEQMDPAKIIQRSYSESEFVRKHFTKGRLPGISRKLIPTSVLLSMESRDHVLATTGFRGPYTGYIPK